MAATEVTYTAGEARGVSRRAEQRTDPTPDVVKLFVRQGVSIMPPFRKTEITDAQMNALANYLSRASAPK